MESANRHWTAVGRPAVDELGPGSHAVADTPPTDARETIARIWDQLGGPISSAAMRARALRSRYDGDPQLRGELDALIAELDGVFTAILHTDGRPSADASSRSDSGTGWPEEGAELRFCQWVAGHAPGPSGRAGWSPVSGSADPASLIDELARIGQAMPREIASTLGLPAQASYADGVDRLRWARHSADGPRCRSYRSACLFLADADIVLLPPPATARLANGDALRITLAEQQSSSHRVPRTPA
jgi:hypothetical protein